MSRLSVFLLVLVFLCLANTAFAVEPANHPPKQLNPPVADGIWVRPGEKWPAQPAIGFKNGIQIGIWPMGGPRGLIRIYTPYTFHGQGGIVTNFIAIEPAINYNRCLSELEMSQTDNVQGKRFWFTDYLTDYGMRLPWQPSRGKISKIKVDGKEIETLSIVVNCETLSNGAAPQVLVTFRADRPEEVSLKTYAAKGSAPMDACILTSTMSNFYRNRWLWLKNEVIDSRKLWPDYKGDGFVYAPEVMPDRFLKSPDGTMTVAVTPNEKDVAAVKKPGMWYCGGEVATQYWRKYPGTVQRDLRVNVNGRAMYWMSHNLLPGGIAFENFELIEYYAPGDEFVFGVTLKTPEQLGWPASLRPKD